MRRSATQPDRPDPLTATAPTQVWSGDSTSLATTVTGLFCYLYLFPDGCSRPAVSDDNPCSEARFKTLKDHPGAPGQPFERLEDARQWVAAFMHGYNEQHRHSALKFVTPGPRHRGEERA